ncbi:hypothetical protein Tdes44962_MAKER05464 [Teratosphaeria destructans]|uniref:F-box domain-containing protein n=1 Tax=Teratosphaeria destructans TaxID=418781 RepID=A0A9W7SJV5_9PEZI|nr:hypothetical protein Tdes44962_MAKER05464 [Teratosphaeria destructans]
MDKLPEELLEAVLKHLPLADLMRARRVCRAFRDTIATAPELRRLQKFAAVFGNVALLEKVTDDLERKEFRRTTRVCQVFRRGVAASEPMKMRYRGWEPPRWGRFNYFDTPFGCFYPEL